MTTLTSALLLLTSMQTPQPASGWGTVRVGVKEIPVSAPEYQGLPYSQPFAYRGDWFTVDANGDLQRLVDVDLGAYMQRASDQPTPISSTGTPWRIYVRVRSRDEQTVIGPDGVSIKRYYLDRPEIEAIEQSLMELAARAKLESGGLLHLEYDFHIDGAPRRSVIVNSADGQEPAPALESVSLNEASWDDEEGKIHSGYQGQIEILAGGAPNTISGSAAVPCASASFIGPGTLSNRLTDAWRQIVGTRSAMAGYRSMGPVGTGSKAFWEAVFNAPYTTSEWYAARWNAGVDKFDWAANLAYNPAQVPTEKHGIWVTSPSGTVLGMTLDAAVFLGTNFGTDIGARRSSPEYAWVEIKNPSNQSKWELNNRALGEVNLTGQGNWMEIAEGKAIFRGPKPTVGEPLFVSDDTGLHLLVRAGAGEGTFFSQNGENLPKASAASGYSDVLVKRDGGPITVKTAAGISETIALKDASGRPAMRSTGASGSFFIDADKQQVTIQPGGLHGQLMLTEPFGLKLDNPVITAKIASFRQWQLKWVLNGENHAAPFFPAGFEFDGKPHEIIIRFPVGVAAVTGISIAADEETDQYVVGTSPISISDLKVISSGKADPSENTLVQNPVLLSTILNERKPESLIAYLKSASREHRLAALAAAGHTQLTPDLELELKTWVKNIDYAESYLALRAMRTSADAAAIFMNAIELGPFDHNREAAARLLPDALVHQMVPKLAATITSLEWPVRLAAAKRLAGDKSEAGSISLLIMLRDPEPAVRTVAAQGLDETFELANRRLLFAAVNDPNEVVRGTAYAKLMSSPLKDFRDQAMRGVRDESPAVRIAVLDAMGKAPKPDLIPWIELAAGDANPRVRAAAITAFAAQKVKVSEPISKLRSDPYPAIQEAFKLLPNS